MIYWLRLLGLIFAVIALIALVGTVLPRAYDFEVTQTIQATPEDVYQQIDVLPKWQSWSQWSLDNPTIKTLEYSADELTQNWSDERGTGKLWITDRQENQSVSYSMTFANFPEMKSEIELAATGDGSTQVRWVSQGQLPSGPFYGFFGPFFSTGMKSHYQYGLGKLAEACKP